MKDIWRSDCYFRGRAVDGETSTKIAVGAVPVSVADGKAEVVGSIRQRLAADNGTLPERSNPGLERQDRLIFLGRKELDRLSDPRERPAEIPALRDPGCAANSAQGCLTALRNDALPGFLNVDIDIDELGSVLRDGVRNRRARLAVDDRRRARPRAADSESGRKGRQPLGHIFQLALRRKTSPEQLSSRDPVAKWVKHRREVGIGKPVNAVSGIGGGAPGIISPVSPIAAGCAIAILLIAEPELRVTSGLRVRERSIEFDVRRRRVVVIVGSEFLKLVDVRAAGDWSRIERGLRIGPALAVEVVLLMRWNLDILNEVDGPREPLVGPGEIARQVLSERFIAPKPLISRPILGIGSAHAIMSAEPRDSFVARFINQESLVPLNIGVGAADVRDCGGGQLIVVVASKSQQD